MMVINVLYTRMTWTQQRGEFVVKIVRKVDASVKTTLQLPQLQARCDTNRTLTLQSISLANLKASTLISLTHVWVNPGNLIALQIKLDTVHYIPIYVLETSGK